MKEKIEKFCEEKEKLTNELKEWVKNTNIPVEERFDVFIKSGLGEHDSFNDDFQSIDLDDYYANKDKHQTIKPNEILDYIRDTVEDFEVVEKEFKEEILKKFIKSWEYYW